MLVKVASERGRAAAVVGERAMNAPSLAAVVCADCAALLKAICAVPFRFMVDYELTGLGDRARFGIVPSLTRRLPGS